jgi:hypothetical protein
VIPSTVPGSDSERAALAPGQIVALHVLVAVLVGTVAFVVFPPVLHGEFLNFDDRYLYLESSEYRGLDARHLAWTFKTTRLGHYAPLTWLSAALDYLAFGIAPYAFHRTSLILHAANTALFALLAILLLRRARQGRAAGRPIALALPAGAAALLFALHRLRVESVAWITERRGLLAAFFLLLALLSWLRACSPGRVALASRTWYALSLLALSASVLSKGLALNRLDDAITVFRDAVAEIESLDRTRFNPRPYLALGVALLRKGEIAEGRRHLELAAQFPETREQALRALGR